MTHSLDTCTPCGVHVKKNTRPHVGLKAWNPPGNAYNPSQAPAFHKSHVATSSGERRQTTTRWGHCDCTRREADPVKNATGKRRALTLFGWKRVLLLRIGVFQLRFVEVSHCRNVRLVSHFDITLWQTPTDKAKRYLSCGDCAT